ncbi:MAG: DNA topoisomerase [Candidatus Hodarchaeales archaeon]|jgi:DNA topoisomerase-1
MVPRLYLRIGLWKGKELTFIPLIGHITSIDTPKEFGWNKCPPLDIARNPKALVLKTNQTFQRIIRNKAKLADELWLATDPDSEGDNIAFEAYTIAINANPYLKRKTRRVWNSSLTKQEIIRAFQNLIPWQLYLALAVQGRRMVDAWVGFAGTREVTGAARQVLKQGGVVLSVGRVQLPTLKLIVDRDRERNEFHQKLKYNILADMLDDSRKEVLVTLKHVKSPFKEKKPVQMILEKIQTATTGIITEFKTWKNTIPPPRPWNTTDALVLLTKKLKVKAETAMSLLTRLYEKGYISYPRTDNRRFKENFPHNTILSKLKSYTSYKPLLESIADSTQVRSNGRKQGTEDHDPIHPTGEIPTEDAMITKQHLKAWDYVSRYYIGMFMPNLVQSLGSVKVSIKQEPFNQKYQQILERGWVKAITWKKPKETKVFSFTKSQTVQVRDIRSESFKTKPPPQWNDSSLIRQLEKLRIGTKSSRPEILKKLESRNYIVRQKKTLYESTSIGFAIIQVFEKIWPELVTPIFTRRVEAMMDDVATQKASYENMLESLRQHYIQLHQKLLSQLPELKELLGKEMGIQRAGKSVNSKSNLRTQVEVCPLCQEGKLIQRTNYKTKNIFFGCSRYPSCMWTAPSKKISGGRVTPAITTKDIVGPCPICEGTLFLKRIKEFRLVGCSEYPKCNSSYFLPKKGRLSVLKNSVCPSCNRQMISHVSRSKKSGESQKKTYCVICTKP